MQNEVFCIFYKFNKFQVEILRGTAIQKLNSTQVSTLCLFRVGNIYFALDRFSCFLD